MVSRAGIRMALQRVDVALPEEELNGESRGSGGRIESKGSEW